MKLIWILQNLQYLEKGSLTSTLDFNFAHWTCVSFQMAPVLCSLYNEQKQRTGKRKQGVIMAAPISCSRNRLVYSYTVLIRDMVKLFQTGTDALWEQWESSVSGFVHMLWFSPNSDESQWRFINQPELCSPSVFSSTTSCELQPLAISAAIKRFLHIVSFFWLIVT